MESAINKLSKFNLNDKTKNIILNGIIYLFIALFVYTAISKFKTMDDFVNILGRSPLIGSYNVIVAWAVPLVEIIIASLLIIPVFKRIGLLAALILMISFTTFLIYGIFSGSKLPCHCGGVISSLSWKEHIWFNIGFIILAVIGLQFYKRE